MSLLGYVRLAAGVFVVVALVGFASAGYLSFYSPGFPENLMHLLIGLLFAYIGFSSRMDDDSARVFVGGMGVLLLLGKGVFVALNLWGGQSLFGTVTEVVCVVLGVSSILAALYLR